MGGFYTSTLALSTAQDTSVQQIDRLAIVNPATADSIADILAMIADQSVAAVGGTPAGHAIVAGSIADKLKLLASGGAGQLTAARIANLDNIASIASVPLISNNVPIVGASSSAGSGAVALSDGTAANSYGAWVQIAAALAGHAAWYLAVRGTSFNTGVEGILQLGEGAGGSEASIGSYPWVCAASGVGGQSDICVIPLVPARQITANARLSAHITSTGTGNSFTLTVGIIPRPL